MRGTRSLRTLSLVLFGATAVITCYGPTEMLVDVTTDLECTPENNIQTHIFKGTPERPDLHAEATTRPGQCGPSEIAGVQRIGTLVFVPSGDRDGRARVDVVLSRGKLATPESCRAAQAATPGDPSTYADCIFATRVFSYLPHTSRRLPIHLSKDCIGYICPQIEQTCIRGRRCVP